MRSAAVYLRSAGVYVRVSTGVQEVKNQEPQLRALCKARGWKVVRTYRDKIGGADPRKIAFNRLMHDARVGKVRVIVFWAWDRVTRGGILETFRIMERWREWGIAWESLKEPFLSSGSDPVISEVLLAIIAWAAEQEKLRISERTKAGLARRKNLGFKLGRPMGSRDRKPRARKKRGPLEPAWNEPHD